MNKNVLLHLNFRGCIGYLDDDILLNLYGIKRHAGYYRYFQISDESKFALFMLKHPEVIKEIVYE